MELPDAAGLEVGLPDAAGLEVGLPDAAGLEVGLPDAAGLEDGLPDAAGLVVGQQAAAVQGQGLEMGPTGPEVEAEKVSHIDLSSLPGEIVYCIAERLAPSRRSVEAMRAVCRQWRDSVPPTRGPWLVLSSMNVGHPSVFLRIEQGVLVRQNPLFQPPQAHYCWSCSDGVLALEVPQRIGYRLCVNCGCQKLMAHLPENLQLTNISETPRLLCAFSADDTLVHWSRHKDTEWSLFDYRLDIEPKSLSWNWKDGVACIVAAPSTLIIDALFEERLLPTPVDKELEELVYDEPGVVYQHPVPSPVVIDFPLDIPPTMVPWPNCGYHTFHVGNDTYVFILLRHTQDQHVEVRLLVLYADADGENGALLPAHTIGNHALFVGANQAFVTVAGLGLMPNTAYVVDNDSSFQAPRVLAIDILTGQQAILSYPDGIESLDSFMTPSWLAALPDAELDWHCNK